MHDMKPMDNGAQAGDQLTPPPSRSMLVPALVAPAGDRARVRLLEFFAAMANHASTRTTQLYDRRRDEVSLDEVKRISI
jgi:hypothetical protein